MNNEKFLKITALNDNLHIDLFENGRRNIVLIYHILKQLDNDFDNYFKDIKSFDEIFDCQLYLTDIEGKLSNIQNKIRDLNTNE